MPPPACAPLPLKVLLVTVSAVLTPLLRIPPTLDPALLPLKVLLVTVSVAAKLTMPPPSTLPVLPLKVLLVTVSLAPALLKMAPPSVNVSLPLKVLLVTFSVPEFNTPPPFPLVLPLAMVRSLRVTLTPLLTMNTRTPVTVAVCPPLIVPGPGAPLPSMVRFLSRAMVLASVIVPLQLNFTVSFAAALAITFRRVPVALLSSHTLTVSVAASAAAGGTAATPTSSAPAASARHGYPKRLMARMSFLYLPPRSAPAPPPKPAAHPPRARAMDIRNASWLVCPLGTCHADRGPDDRHGRPRYR